MQRGAFKTGRHDAIESSHGSARERDAPCATIRNREIEEAFATMVRERISALFITGNAFLGSRAGQVATLAARLGIATSAPTTATR